MKYPLHSLFRSSFPGHPFRGQQISRSICAALVGMAWWLTAAMTQAAADLYLRDGTTDLGVEPNAVSIALWAGDDIWVRQDADPSYQPYPAREAAPGWTPLPHQNPLYRPLRRQVPNYIYVRVRNRGNAASLGSERLRVYWSAEGASPRWPDDFVQRVTPSCDGHRLVARGMEVTRGRMNAAAATAEERERWIRTMVEWGMSRADGLPEGSTWWKHVALCYAEAPAWAHDTPAFLVWHRAFLQQIELWLQEHDPRVQLMYWDWSTDPEKSGESFHFFTPEFMGRSGRGTAGENAGLPFEGFGRPIVRALADGLPDVVGESLILNASDYAEFRGLLEGGSWNKANAYIGGVGNLGQRKQAASDPFFLLVCANADRLWAQWQRNPNFPARLDALTSYGTESGSAALQELTLSPWNGDQDLYPWKTSGGEVVVRTAKDASLVTPPAYDTAPLLIPVLQPGEAVVLQIPWYPPDPSTLGVECDAVRGANMGLTLLARIETSTDSPFGMTEPEITDVVANARANNNVALKRVRVLDDFNSSTRTAEIVVRHDGIEPAMRSLRLVEAGSAGEPSFLNAGRVVVDLGEKLGGRWQNAGAHGTGLEVLQDGKIRMLSNQATIRDIPMEPGDLFPIWVNFEVSSTAPPQFGQVSRLDWQHLGTTANPDAVVGGERFVLDFNRLVLVKQGAVWSFWDQADPWPGPDWFRTAFDDSAWRQGSAPLGYGEREVRTRLREIRLGDPSVTAYFRHHFQVDDPAFIRSLQMRIRQDDGVVVYLNGEEVYRNKMSNEPVEPSRFALDPLTGVNEQLYRVVNLDRSVGLLEKGDNLLAVEVHQAALLNPESIPIPDDDLIMDLELSGNPPGVNQQAFIRVLSPERFAVHQLGRPIAIEAESVDVDGAIRNGIFQGDNLILASFAKIDPVKLFHEKFVWSNARLGRRVVTVASFDELGSLSFVQQPILVVNNTPPWVRFTAPADGTVLPLGQPWSLELETSDEVGGGVARVELMIREGDGMTAVWRSLGTLFEPPYIWEAEPLASGDYTVQAVATDTQGAVTVSVPVRLQVPPPEVLLLEHRFAKGALVLEWTMSQALLEQARQPDGPWEVVQDAVSPWSIDTEQQTEAGVSAGRFYRLRSANSR